MATRSLTLNDYEFYWSPDPGYKNRLLIPFRYHGKIVGWTGRKVTDGKPKYLSDQHPQFVFNIDRQTEPHQYVFVCEGPLDAIAVGGVALLTNNISDQQARIINSLQKTVIVIPDQDRPGLELLNRAIEHDWSVAFPNWDDDVKDCADAVRQYGKLFVIVDIIKTAQQGAIKINIARQYLEQKIKRTEYEKNN
jgi:DNA primase